MGRATALDLSGIDDFFDLAHLADFFVVDYADGHVFADFGGVGDGEVRLVEVWEAAFADGDELPLHLAFDAAVDVHGVEAGLVAGDFHTSALRFDVDVGARGFGVVVDGASDPVELELDLGGAGGARLAALDMEAEDGRVDLQNVAECGGFFLQLFQQGEKARNKVPDR